MVEPSNKVSQRQIHRARLAYWPPPNCMCHVCGGGQNAKMSMEQDLWETLESKGKAQGNEDSLA